MGSCILKFSLSPTFKLLFLCFSCVHFISTTSQIFPPLQGLACAIVNCGEGTCRGSNATLLGVECDCKPGWKQIPVVAFAFPSCALPNCTIDFQCGSGAPPPPLPALKPFNASSPCNLVWCGNGDCVVDETSNTHSCQCNQGFANLLNNPSFGCIEQCTIDFQCGSGAPPPPLPALKPFNASSPCNLVWCGNGDCVVDETSNTHSCQCNQGFANLLNNPSFGCIEQCYLGADCKNLGLGTPPAPPETSSGSPINGTKEHQADAKGSNGASNNMKNIVVALIIALVFQHEFR